ncbi:MAG TPA: DUF4177 domain-containing protein [Gaiellaceae bacterium]
MERWEYRAVSFAEGQYTAMLNQYGAEGWELVGVVPDIRTVPERRDEGGLPVPGFGKLGQAAQAVSKLGEPDDAGAPQPGAITTTFLWVLRRPLEDD